eukprot:sb/3478702/
MDTGNFISILSQQYDEHNVVILTIAPPEEPECLTGLVATWRRVKKDKVIDGIAETFQLSSEVVQQLATAKRGSLCGVALDEEEDSIVPVNFSPLNDNK